MTTISSLARILRRFGRVMTASNFVVFQSLDSSKTIQSKEIANIPGVAKVSSAVEECPSEFSDIVDSIAKIGRRTIIRGQSFFIKVLLLDDHRKFTERDIEFAASGKIIGKLFGFTKAAKTEKTADVKIVAYVGATRTFVSAEEYVGVGGAISGSAGKAVGAITGEQSLQACILAHKFGFELEILLLYTSDYDLRKKAKLVENFITKTRSSDNEKLTVTITRLKEKATYKKSKSKRLLFDFAAAQAMAKTKSVVAILPLSLATHPLWFVEVILRQVISDGKIPLTPLMFCDESCFDISRAAKPQKFSESGLGVIGKPKKIQLEIGSNYLHHIIDSV